MFPWSKKPSPTLSLTTIAPVSATTQQSRGPTHFSSNQALEGVQNFSCQAREKFPSVLHDVQKLLLNDNNLKYVLVFFY